MEMRQLFGLHNAILACSKYYISEGIVNRAVSICPDSRAALLALKSYAVSAKVVLQCRNLLQELALSNRVRLMWDPIDTVVSMGMKKPTHLQEQYQVLLL
jgi:hypothetical protein